VAITPLTWPSRIAKPFLPNVLNKETHILFSKIQTGSAYIHDQNHIFLA